MMEEEEEQELEEEEKIKKKKKIDYRAAKRKDLIRTLYGSFDLKL